MDDLPFTPVELVAIDAGRNIRRRWRIVAYRDLFGQVMVETGWGRIGGRGRELVRSFADEAAARVYVRRLLARRTSAPRRLGVAYRPLPTCLHVDIIMPDGRRAGVSAARSGVNIERSYDP